MKKTIGSFLCIAGLALASMPALAVETGAVEVLFEGPGGHSSSNYGRTSALHAAGRAVIMLQDAGLPAGSYKIMGIKGGNSVNSIASDGLVEIRLTAPDEAAYDQLVATITQVAAAGAAAENAFRNVSVGQLTSGVPAWIRSTVTRQ